MELNLIAGVALITLGAIIKPIQIIMSNCTSDSEKKEKIKSNKTLPFLAITYILLGAIVVAAHYIFISIELHEPINSIATIFIILAGIAIINTISIKRNR